MDRSKELGVALYAILLGAVVALGVLLATSQDKAEAKPKKAVLTYVVTGKYDAEEHCWPATETEPAHCVQELAFLWVKDQGAGTEHSFKIDATVFGKAQVGDIIKFERP